MFNLSGSELVVIMLLALVILGPDRLPDAMRKAGKTFGEFKKLTSGFQDEVRKGFEEPAKEIKQTAAAVRKAAAFTTDQRSSAAPKQRYNPNVDPKPVLPPGSSVAQPAREPAEADEVDPAAETVDAETLDDAETTPPELDLDPLTDSDADAATEAHGESEPDVDADGDVALNLDTDTDTDVTDVKDDSDATS